MSLASLMVMQAIVIARCCTRWYTLILCVGVADHVMLQYFSSRAIRRLVLTAAEQNNHVLPDLLWKAAFQGKCAQWVGTHAEKILAALSSCRDVALQEALNNELQPILNRQVANWAAEFVQQGKAAARKTGKKQAGKLGEKQASD